MPLQAFFKSKESVLLKDVHKAVPPCLVSLCKLNFKLKYYYVIITNRTQLLVIKLRKLLQPNHDFNQSFITVFFQRDELYWISPITAKKTTLHHFCRMMII